MADDSPSSKVLFALAAALGVALLVIAFLVGRESAQHAPNDAKVVEHRLPPIPHLGPEAEPDTQNETSGARNPWQERDEEYAHTDANWRPLKGLDERPDGTIVLSNARHDDEAINDSADPHSAPPEATRGSDRAAVAGYFQQVDVIRSNAGAGDPNTFAMDMIKAGMGGATSGFDRLIADTDRMAQELKRMTPPPSCLLYHQASLGSLEEARTMLEGLKVAITTRDVQSLTMIAQQAANLQDKAETLKALRKQIKASAP